MQQSVWHTCCIYCRSCNPLCAPLVCKTSHFAYLSHQSVLHCRVRYNIPPYSLLQSNRQACLVLFPTDWALTNAQPVAPHMLLIGAITAQPAKPLPQELESFVQSAGEHGVVYASLGTTAMPGESVLAPTVRTHLILSQPTSTCCELLGLHTSTRLSFALESCSPRRVDECRTSDVYVWSLL